jgi:hypothetical protein
MTDKTRHGVNVALRIPGRWRGPEELIDRFPDGFRLDDPYLVLPDRSRVEMIPLPPDGEFPSVFRSSLRRPATAEELDVVDRYTANVALVGPGGSLDAARRMLRAGGAIIEAGGGGVFIDNSALSHGGENWCFMADDGSSDAVSFAFVGIVRGRDEVWTVGMHVLGFPELLMRRADADADDAAIIEMIRYVSSGERTVGDGHVIADEQGPRFQISHELTDSFDVASPMHNPWGRFRMIRIEKIVERYG